MEFSRQQYCSGLPFPSPGDLPDPGIKPRSPALQADALLSELPGTPHAHRRHWKIFVELVSEFLHSPERDFSTICILLHL